MIGIAAANTICAVRSRKCNSIDRRALLSYQRIWLSTSRRVGSFTATPGTDGICNVVSWCRQKMRVGMTSGSYSEVGGAWRVAN